MYIYIFLYVYIHIYMYIYISHRNTQKHTHTYIDVYEDTYIVVWRHIYRGEQCGPHQADSVVFHTRRLVQVQKS